MGDTASATLEHRAVCYLEPDLRLQEAFGRHFYFCGHCSAGALLTLAWNVKRDRATVSERCTIVPIGPPSLNVFRAQRHGCPETDSTRGSSMRKPVITFPLFWHHALGCSSGRSEPYGIKRSAHMLRIMHRDTVRHYLPPFY